jgi:3-oxoacyl-[acyl-carrier protein] reductase
VGYVCFDASDPAAVSAALDSLPARIDVLVNNAGGNTDFDREPAGDGDLAGLAAAWRANLDANLLPAVAKRPWRPGARTSRPNSGRAASRRT